MSRSGTGIIKSETIHLIGLSVSLKQVMNSAALERGVCV